MIDVTIYNGSVVADLKGKGGQIMKGAVRAMNRAIQSGRTAMTREIAQDTGLRSSDVRDAMPINQATAANPKASFGATLKRIPLIYFRATGPMPSRGKGRGVSYKLQGGRSRIPNAFITTFASGHPGVFVRAGKGRLPIVELYGPSLGHVFAKYRPTGIARTKEAFDTAFAHELERLTGKQVVDD